jgi:hypothetical protein
VANAVVRSVEGLISELEQGGSPGEEPDEPPPTEENNG